MRKKIVAGNWKMNTMPSEGNELAKSINEFVLSNKLNDDVKVILGVPFTHIDKISTIMSHEKLSLSAQNCCMYSSGAYTGEISAKMIKSLNCNYVIIGHSERRQYFGETDEVVAAKLEQCYENDLIPILCCGEKLEEREEENHFNIVKFQLVNALAKIDSQKMTNTVIAYEPVWAIGTGRTASPQQAQEMHEFIRSTIKELYGESISKNISILYGGSVNAANASELFSCEDIDGGLVGGASLKADEFIKIIKSI
jgi:triosephosphate isomerase (TIM)